MATMWTNDVNNKMARKIKENGGRIFVKMAAKWLKVFISGIFLGLLARLVVKGITDEQ